MKITPEHALIIGFHDARNKGDLAILESEIQILKETFHNPRISVSATYPEILRSLHPNLPICLPLIDLSVSNDGTFKNRIKRMFYPVIILDETFLTLMSVFCVKLHFPLGYRVEILKYLEEADLVLATGGGYLKEGSFNLPQNVHSKLAHFGSLFARCFEIVISKEIFNKKVVMFPQSIGPFRTSLGRLMARIILAHVDYVMLRESYSLNMLKTANLSGRFGVPAVAALMLNEQVPHRSKRCFIGVCPRLGDFISTIDRVKYVKGVADLLDFLVEQFEAEIKFLPSNVAPGWKDDDLSICHQIRNQMRHKRSSEVVVVSTVSGFRRHIGEVHLLLTGRLHAAIMAALGKIPFILIVCEHKQVGFLKQLGLENLGVDIKNVCFESLQSKTLFALAKSDEISRSLESGVRELRSLARASIVEMLDEFSA